MESKNLATQRPIRFRIWDKYNKRWAHAPLLAISDSGALFYNVKDEDGGRDEDRFVIQQFTGIIDRHGKPIFEGDIVQFWIKLYEHDTEEVTGEVFFQEGIFYFDRSYMLAMNDGNLIEKTIEVIGNVFENHELPT